MKKLTISILMLIICEIAFKGATQESPVNRQFKIALTIISRDINSNNSMNLMNIYTRDSLGEIEDIEIVNAKTGDWEYLLRIYIMKPEYESGELSDMNVIVADYFTREILTSFFIDKETIKKVYPNSDLVLYPNTQEVMMVSDKKLKTIAETLILILDQGYIQKEREQIKNLPNTPDEVLEYLEKLENQN